MEKKYTDLLNYLQEIPGEDKRDEATATVLQAARDSITLKKLKKLIPDYERKLRSEEKEERSYLKFTQKELSQMPNDFQQIFIIDNHIVRYRLHRGMYHARYRRDGYNIEVASSNFEVMKKKFITALIEQTASKPTKAPLLKEYSLSWLNEKKSTVKDSTYKSYETLIKGEILPNLGELHIDKITRKEVQDYLFRLVSENKNRTAEKVKQTLNAIFDVAAEDYNFKSPMSKIKLPHYETKKGTPLSKEEEKRLVDFCINNRHLYGVSSLLILTYTGLRVGELKSMTIEEKNGYRYFECTTEKTRLGYGEKRRRIPISPMMEKILPYVNLNNAVNAAKKTISDTLKRIFPERHVHELRYTFISRCKEAGCNLELVMAWDGHEFDADVKSSKVDRGYTRYADEYYFGEIKKVNYEL